MSRVVAIIVLVLVVPGAFSGVALAQDDAGTPTPTETAANETSTDTPESAEAPTETPSETATSTPTPTEAPAAGSGGNFDLNIDLSGLTDWIGGGDDEDALETGVIRYEETEGEGYASEFDWNHSQLVDTEFDPSSNTAVFIFYSAGDDRVAITEGREDGRLSQTRAEFDQGAGMYWVRADIHHNDGILGGWMSGSIATQKGDIDLYKARHETGMGNIIPETPTGIGILMGALSVAVATFVIAREVDKRRRNSVSHK